jgi:hypothetical protein
VLGAARGEDADDVRWSIVRNRSTTAQPTMIRSGEEYPSTGGAPQAPVTAHTTERTGSKWAGI